MKRLIALIVVHLAVADGLRIFMPKVELTMPHHFDGQGGNNLMMMNKSFIYSSKGGSLKEENAASLVREAIAIHKLAVATPATIVTAYFEMKSKHSLNDYRSWMKNFFALQDPMVVFTSPDMVDFVQAARPRKHYQTHIVSMNLNEGFMATKYGMDFWRRQHKKDPEKHTHKSPEMYVVWNEKADFLKRAADLNPFKSEFLAWMDAGYCRDVKMNGDILLRTIPEDLRHDQVLMLEIGKDGIGGGFIGGFAKGISVWHEVYYKTIDANKEKFIGKEQPWMKRSCSDHPHLCYLVQPDSEHGDPWMYMAPFMHGDTEITKSEEHKINSDFAIFVKSEDMGHAHGIAVIDSHVNQAFLNRNEKLYDVHTTQIIPLILLLLISLICCNMIDSATTILVLKIMAFLTCGMVLIVLNKYIMQELSFKYPFTLSGLGLLTTGLITRLSVDVFGISTVKSHTMNAVAGANWFIKVLPIATCKALTLALGNSVYIQLDLGLIQMLKAANPAIIFFIMKICGLPTPSKTAMFFVCMIIAGTMVMVSDAVNAMHATTVGLIMMFVSELSEAVALVLTQTFLQTEKFSVVETLYILALPGCALLFSVAAVLEWPNIYNHGHYMKLAHYPLHFAAAALLGLAVNFSSMIVLEATSSLALKVSIAARNSVLIVIAHFVYYEVLTTMEIWGYAIAIVGFLGYTWVQSRPVSANEEFVSHAVKS